MLRSEKTEFSHRDVDIVLMPTMMLSAVFLVALAYSVDGFVKSRTFQSRLPFSRLFDNHFDDFDFVIGEQGSAPSDLLRERMRQVQQEDVRKDKQIAKNWKTGNWKVRGFSLDKHDPTASTKLEARRRRQLLEKNQKQCMCPRCTNR